MYSLLWGNAGFLSSTVGCRVSSFGLRLLWKFGSQVQVGGGGSGGRGGDG